MAESAKPACLVLQVDTEDEPVKTENKTKALVTTRVSLQQISAVDVPYFDMSLSESGTSESEIDDRIEENENIDPIKIDKNDTKSLAEDPPNDISPTQRPPDQNPPEKQPNSTEKQSNSAENPPNSTEMSKNSKKYDRISVKNARRKAEIVVKIEEKVDKVKSEPVEDVLSVKNANNDVLAAKNANNDVLAAKNDVLAAKNDVLAVKDEVLTAKTKKDVCYLEDLIFDDEEDELEPPKKRKKEEDSDFNPDDCADECSSDWESGNSDDCEDYDVVGDDGLVSLEGTRYNNFDESITCFLCGKSHAARSECRLYDGGSHSVVEDLVNDKGEVLYDYESLPQILRFTDPDDFSSGICADAAIQPLTRFGPLVAQDFQMYTLGFDNALADVWLLIEEDNQFKALTTNDNARSNWFRYVLPANGPRAANTLAVTLDKKLYLVTIKPIAADEELRYWQDEHRDLSRWSVLQSRRGFNKQACGMAHAKFPSRHHYRMHMILFHNFRSKGMLQKHYYYCHVCNGAFFRKEALCTHCQVDHGGVKPFKCYLCGRLILRSSMVRTHVKECAQNSNAVRFPCPECGKLFVRDFYLKRHIATVHLGLREYTCEFCGIQFATDRSVRRHINAVHNGEQPHICDKCGRRFSQGSNLKVHLLTHSGVKPFQCREKGCTAGFTTKQCLQFHYLRVHKYTNENIPEIQRVVPFTYEDHSLNVGDEEPANEETTYKVRRQRRRREPVVSRVDSDEESDWDEKPKRRKRRKRVENGKKRVQRKRVQRKLIKAEDIKVEAKEEVEETVPGKVQNGAVVEAAKQVEAKTNGRGRKSVGTNRKGGQRRRRRRGRRN